MNTIFTRILRIIMALLLLFVVAVTTLSFPLSNWWVFVVLLLLVGNVEITAFKYGKQDIKGVKICRQAKAYWVEEFDKRKNPLGQEYYWLTGKFVNKDQGEDNDET